MRRRLVIGVLVIGMMMFAACGNNPQTGLKESNLFTRNTAISDVITNPVFGDYGRLIFPVDEGYYSGIRWKI